MPRKRSLDESAKRNKRRSTHRRGMYEIAGYKCRECREECPERMDALPGEKFLTLDHIVPRAKGGPSAEWNMRVLCNKCNEAKGDKFDVSMFGPNPPWEYYQWMAQQRWRHPVVSSPLSVELRTTM